MCALEMHTSVQNREYNIHLMLGLGVPEIFRHSGKQVVCLSAGPLGYAALSRHLSLGDSSRADVYYGLDIWTVDSQNEVFCAGISSPLRPSEQSGRSRDIVGTSPCSIQWKCDGGRICVLAQSNVFLLDTTEIFSAPVPRSDLAVPSKLRSVGGIFIPGTCAMGSTNDLIFFGHDDGLLLQYSWEMAFVGVVNLAASAVYLDLWPPQRLSFETLSDPAHAHRSSAGVDLRSDASISRVKPVSNEWSRQRGGELSVRVGCAVCSDGSLCFVLAPADANAGAPCQVSKRVFIESSKRSILHSRIVERYPQFDAQSTSSLNGNMLVNVAVACLVAETAADTSCCFELMVLMLSIDADSLKCLESESFLSDNYAIISVVSSTLLSANCPFKDCFDRDWSSLEYPHSVAVSNNYYSVRNVNDTTELKISLSEHTIGRIRKDEMFVILGGRVFCVKLDYRFSDEQSLSNHVLSVATVKFSLDCSKHSSVLDKKLPDTSSFIHWKNMRLIVCFFALRSDLVMVESKKIVHNESNIAIVQIKASKMYHFPVYSITSSILIERPNDYANNSVVFCHASGTLHIPNNPSIGAKSAFSNLNPRCVPDLINSKGDFLSNATVDIGRSFCRVAVPPGLRGLIEKKRSRGWVVASDPNLSYTAIFVNKYLHSGLSDFSCRATLWILRIASKKWKLIDLYSNKTAFINESSNEEEQVLLSHLGSQSLLVEACQWFGDHSCVFASVRGKVRALEVISVCTSHSSFTAAPVSSNQETFSKRNAVPSAHAIYNMPGHLIDRLCNAPVTYLDICYDNIQNVASPLSSCTVVIGNQYAIVGFCIVPSFQSNPSDKTCDTLNRIQSYSVSAATWSVNLLGSFTAPTILPRTITRSESEYLVKRSFVRHPIVQVVGMPVLIDEFSDLSSKKIIDIAVVDAIGQLFKISFKNGISIEQIQLCVPQNRSECSKCDVEPERWLSAKLLLPMYDNRGLTAVGSNVYSSIVFTMLIISVDGLLLSDFRTPHICKSPKDVIKSAGKLRILHWVPTSDTANAVEASVFNSNDHQLSANIAFRLVYFSGISPQRSNSHGLLAVVKPFSHRGMQDHEILVDISTNPVMFAQNQSYKEELQSYRNRPGLALDSTDLGVEIFSITMSLVVWALHAKSSALLANRIGYNRNNTWRTLSNKVWGEIRLNFTACDDILFNLSRRPRCLCIFVHMLELYILNLASDFDFLNPLLQEFNSSVETSDEHEWSTSPGAKYARTISLMLLINEFIMMEVVTRVSRKMDLTKSGKLYPLPVIFDKSLQSDLCNINLFLKNQYAQSNLGQALEKYPDTPVYCTVNEYENDAAADLTSFLGLGISICDDKVKNTAPRCTLGACSEFMCGWTEFELFKYCMSKGNLNHAARLLPLAITSVMELQARCSNSSTMDLSKVSHILALDLLSECWRHLYLNRLVQELLGFTGRVEYAMNIESSEAVVHPDNPIIPNDSNEASFIQKLISSMMSYFDEREAKSVAVTSIDERPSENAESQLKSILQSKINICQTMSALPEALRKEIWEFEKLYPWNCIVLQHNFSNYGVADILTNVLSELTQSLEFISVAFMVNHAISNSHIRDKIAQKIQIFVERNANLVRSRLIIDGVDRRMKDSGQHDCKDYKRHDINMSPSNVKLIEHMLNMLCIYDASLSNDDVRPEAYNYIMPLLKRKMNFDPKFVSTMKKMRCTVPMPLLISLCEEELSHVNVTVRNGANSRACYGNDVFSSFTPAAHASICPPNYGELLKEEIGKGENHAFFSPMFFFRLVSISCLLTSESFDILYFTALADGNVDVLKAVQQLSCECSNCVNKETVESNLSLVLNYLLFL